MFVALSFAAWAAECDLQPRVDPSAPALMSLNTKDISVASHRRERMAGLVRSLDPKVGVLLLSEARVNGPLRRAFDDTAWCLYGQVRDGDALAYEVLDGSPSVTGLVLAIRTDPYGERLDLGGPAGDVYDEGAAGSERLGALMGWHKGWARVDVHGAAVFWTHTQASYYGHPERGAAVRARQVDALAEVVHGASQSGPTLVVGDFNAYDQTTEGRFAVASESDAVWVRKLAPGVSQTGLLPSYHCAFDRAGETCRRDVAGPLDRAFRLDLGVAAPVVVLQLDLALATPGRHVSDHDAFVFEVAAPEPPEPIALTSTRP